MLSKKLKAQLKRIATSTILAVSTVAVLFGMGANLDSIVNTVKDQIAKLQGEEVKAENAINVIKDSTGINLEVKGSDDTRVNKIEVYQGTTKVQEYNYSDSQTQKEEKIKITVPFGETHQITVMVNGVAVAQKEVQNLRYISNAQDMVKFRDTVNAGKNFSGKYVELLNNIDMSTVCSSTVGSWVPIGAVGTAFAGTFNGNYYNLQNLYINTNAYLYLGLFASLPASAIIENLGVTNCYIYGNNSNTNSACVGGIAGTSAAMIRRCHVSGHVEFYSNAKKWTAVGGIIGEGVTNSQVYECYNNASVRSTNNTSSDGNHNSQAGGIVGYNTHMVNSCYNTGSIYAKGNNIRSGGICGVTRTYALINSYSIGSCTGSGSQKLIGGICGTNGNSSYKAGTVSNCYCGTSTTYSYYYYSGGFKSSTSGRVTTTNIQGYANTLGAAAWATDSWGINGGYPIFRWQIPSIEFDKKQEYVHVGDQIQLNVDTKKYTAESAIGSITYATDNASVATVDSNGLVTAVGEGYTTIFATESTYGLKAMMIINVAKQGTVAYAQSGSKNIGVTDATTLVLKEDGTVWGVGDNSYGMLGDGTNTSSNSPVQVMINKNTPLTNIVKISVGYYHVLAITKDGDLYAWGSNSNGQLGINNTDSKNYATRVLNNEGTEPLYSIVDIAAGSNSSIAMDRGGNVYTWGRNDRGQLGIGNTTDKYLPQITLCSQAIKIDQGATESIILRPSGTVETWGYNGSGGLGVGNTSNATLPGTTNTANVVDISSGACTTLVRNISGNVYFAGDNSFGKFGNATTTNSTTYTASTVPTDSSSGIKSINVSGRNTRILFNDGTLWTTGDNTYKQLSDGTTATQSTSFVQGLNSDGTEISNAKNIGSSRTSILQGEVGYQTLTYIDNDGYVNSIGDNSFAQFGNGTSDSSDYYTRMGAPYLRYSKNEIVLNEGESFNISRNDFDILGEFNVDINFTPTAVGTLKFETTDENISVNSATGKVTGLEEGFARVKVTDETNGYETYIIVKVVNKKYENVQLGSKFTASLTTDGDVWTWGSNTFGELGTNSNKPYEDEPKQVKTISNIKDIGVGYYHVVALKENGKVYTWGLNNNGQLGNGTTDNKKEPVEISGLSNIVKVDAYKYITTALDSSGNLYAWGEGYGNTPKLVATNILDMSEDALITSERKVMMLDGRIIHNVRNAVKVSSGENGLLVILDNGQVISIDNSETITDLGVTKGVEVSCGNGFNYILDADKKAYTYGANTNGEQGNGTNTVVAGPTLVAVSDVEVISAGEGNHGALATYDGSIYTTGLNDKGQLGHKNIDNKNLFEMVLNVAIESNVDKVVEQIGESTVVDIGLGMNLNLKRDLTEGSTSDITIVDSTIADLVENVDGTYTVTGRSYGRTFLNATIHGTVNGEEREFATNVEVRIVPEGGITVPQIKSGDSFSIALKSNGKVYAWGNNQYGQLGLGDNNNYDEPKEMASLEETIVEISAGTNHVLALTENGTIYGWGLNDHGQVGNGTNANQLEQATVINIYGNELNKIIRVEAHGDNSFAINEDGKVYAWGKDFGKRAVELQDVENAIDVSTSNYVKADGTVYNMDTLEKLAIVGTVRTMDEGADHSVFLTTEGMAYAIGDNSFGQLGNSTNLSSPNGVQAIRKNEQDIFEGITAIEAGDRYTILLKNDGTVYTCGANENGRLGISEEILDIATPEKNNNISDVMLISAGTNHAVVAKTNGETYSWGKGTSGELGNRKIKNSYTPVMVGPYIIRTDKRNITLGKTNTTEVKGYVDYFNILKEDIIDIGGISKNTQVARITKLNNEDSSLTEEEILKGYKAFRIEGVKEGTTNVVLTENKTNSNGILQIEVLPEAGISISPQVESNASFTVTLKTNGTVWSYGQNTYGELGTGELTASDEPKQVIFNNGSEEPVIIKQIAVGEYHVAALDTEGNVWTWGRNNYYQLGNSNTTSSSTPVKVEGIPVVTRITAGNNSVMAVTEDNKLVAWGQNAYGELGTGEYSNKITPTVIEGVHDVLDIQGGKNHYLLLKTNGEIHTTGSNIYNQLGMDIGDRVRINTFENIPSNLKFGSIAAGWSSSVAITVDNVAYTWGQNTYGNLGDGTKNNIVAPTQISGINGVVEADVGKTHTILRNYNKEIYTVGSNNYGQLGDGTTNNNITFSKNLNIDDVLRVTAGNTYTVVMKSDGTVWAWGDYNHGNRLLKSRTNSKVPVQIGSDTSSLENLEMIIKKSSVASILANSQYQFNLIYEDENETSDFEYESLNEDIATVNEDGNVLGIREGSTWVKVTDTRTGKVSVAIIRVVDNVEGYSVYSSPKVVAGENFAANLREDGSIMVWGYDESKIVDSDVPYSINVVTTYTDIKAGKNHLLVLRNDGTLWTTGNDEYGQLGAINTNAAGKLVQVPNLTDIEKIATGDNFSVAMDRYGITYVWGEEFGTSPQVLDTNIRSVTSLSAGSNDQIVMVLPSGEVYGFGSILNGLLPNFDNAVKVEVGDDYLLILDTNGNVYTYKNGVLSKANTISNAIDINVSGNTNMYQKVNEKVFVWGDNTQGQLGLDNTNSPSTPTEPVNNSTDVYTMGAGRNNTYIIDTLGHVYAAGNNTYGEIGNGTKEDTGADSYLRSLTHTIVGTRNFDIEPVSSIMEVNDVEELTILGATYNVFRQEANKNIDEYDVTIADTSIIEALEENSELTGEIKALSEGLTTIDVTDKVTGKILTLTRKVVPMDQNRIKSILADGNTAEATEPTDMLTYIFGYTVNVPMDDDATEVSLVIEAKDTNDLISIDDGANYSSTNKLTQTITIPTTDSSLVLPVTIKATNGTEFKYELVVNRVSNNNLIDTITVNSYSAIKSLTEEDVYDIVITDLGDNEIIVTAEDTDAHVSIRGKLSELGSQTLSTTIPKGYIEVPIKVTSESGKARNYTLRIHTPEELLELKEARVNNKLAEKQQDGTYKAVIADDISRSSIYAEARYSDNYVEINGSEKELGSLSKNMITTLDENTATIELERTVILDGIEQTINKTYTLKIYKNKVFSLIDEVEVNGEVLEEENNTYIAYVLSNVEEAQIRIKAKENDYTIKFNSNEQTGELTTIESLNANENTYTFTVKDDNDNQILYTLKVIRGETDTTLKKLTVGSGSYVVEATKTEETINDKEVYEAKILDTYLNVDITAQTANRTSKVDINNTGTFVTRIDVENMNLTLKETIVPVVVRTQDEATEKIYYLKILRLEDDVSLSNLSVNELLGNPDITATLEDVTDDSRYEVYLENAVRVIEINATATSNVSMVSISENAEEVQTSSVNITLSSSVTEIPIKVKSEAGTIKTYYLIIHTISDDTGIESVTVNGEQATWNSTNNRYEIKVDRDLLGYEVIATTVNEDAKIAVNGTEAVNTVTKQITNEGDMTLVNIKVTAANDITTVGKKLAIIEKSNNAGLGYVKVNGKALASDENGNYKVEVVSTVQSVLVEVGAQDTFANVNVDGSTQVRVWKGSKVLQTDEEIYDVYITAEDGVTTGTPFTITIIRLDGNTDIDNIEVSYNKNSSLVLKEPILREDGTYYLKIQRPDEERVILRVNLEQAKSTVNVLGTEGKGSIYGYVNLTGEITRIPIVVTAEDGTTYETTLVLEKESNVTTLDQVIVKDYTVTKNGANYTIIADSKVDTIYLSATATHPNAKVKLSTDTDYVEALSLKEVDISNTNEIYIDVLAEDNETTQRHTLQVIRTYNSSLTSVTINGDNATLGNSINVIESANAEIVITAKNDDAEIYLLKDGVEIATGVGTLNVTELVEEETVSVYQIKVQGPDEYVIYKTISDLSIRKKSTNTNANIWLDIDNNYLTYNSETGFYEAIVVGAEHTIGVEKESNYAATKIDEITTDKKEITIGPKTTTTYVVTVIAEDGTEETYNVRIYRKNNDTSIKEVKLKLDLASDENILTALADGSYYYKVPRRQESVIVTLETFDPIAIAGISTEQAINIVTKEVMIDSSLEITNVPLKVIAEDGTEQVVNLKLERESNDATLKELKYNNTVLTQDENEEYTIEVDNRLTNIEIDAIPNHAFAKLRVKGTDTYLSTLNGENVDIEGKEYFEIEVKAEDNETVKTYKVNIRRIFSTKIISVEVDQEEINPSGTSYSSYVDANAANHVIKVTPDNSDAVVTIYDNEDNELITGIGTITLTDTFLEENKLYKVKVQGPTGFEEFESNYTITLNKKSQDTSAKIYINDVEITKDENTGKYSLITKVSNNTVKVVTTNAYAKVSIGGKPVRTQSAEQVYTVNVGQTITVIAKVISQNGEEEDYEIEITRLNNNVNISNITVNDDRAMKITNEIYRNAQPRGLTEATIVITAEYELSSIKAEVDGGEYTDTGELEFNIALPGVGTKTVTITVTAQDGTRKTYTLNIVQNATENINFDITVNNLIPDKLDDSSYRIFVPYTLTSSEVHIEAEEQYTTITSGLYIGNNITFTKTLNIDGDMTVVDFTVESETGVVRDYILYIIKESRDNSIEKLYVNGTEITEDENGRYTAYVDNTLGDPVVKVKTTNEYAYVRIDNFAEEQQETEHICELGETRTTTIPIIVRSQSGERETKYLDIVATFAVVKIESIIVDDIEVTDYDESTKTYVALVENYIPEHEVQIIADNNYATLEFAETVGMGSITSLVEFEEDEEIKRYTLYVTSETDVTTRYTVVIAQKSNNTNLTQVKVNDVTVPLIESTSQYRKNIDLLAEKAKIEVTSEYPYATIKVGDEEIKTKSSGTVWVDLRLDQDEITVPVLVTAADGITIRTYNIVLTRVASTIRGNVMTDNWEGKDVAYVFAYRTSDRREIDDEDDPRELITSTMTAEDGSYELSLPIADSYDIIIKKDSYLTTTITNVEALPYDNVYVQTVKIDAGDIDENGEIELDDLVELNDHIGEVVTSATKKYDLNEDGVIDSKDRALIKNNYHKKERTMVWIDAEGLDFILPLEEGYVISSEYGYRVDPFDGSTKFHSGIDMVGEHHGNIYAVESGQVTYAGVQSGYGNCIEIKHIVNGVTIYSFYAHLSEIDVNVGEYVTQGSIIGLEGGAQTDQNHGTSTGHHLHFELRSESGSGHSLNPHDYLEI